MHSVEISYTLNGAAQRRGVATSLMLIDLLREAHGLSGAKVGCAQGACGACTVLLDGEPVAGCTTFAFQADGREVRTVEGLAQEGRLHPVQQAFVERAAFQCGYCTPGMVLLAVALLEHDPDPDEATVRRWISSSVCRCTGYVAILEAVREAARRAADAKPG